MAPKLISTRQNGFLLCFTNNQITRSNTDKESHIQWVLGELVLTYKAVEREASGRCNSYYTCSALYKKARHAAINNLS